VGRSLLDALGMGTGFLIALFVLGGLREIFGSGKLLGYQVMPNFYEPWLVMILPAGAFLTLGVLFGAANTYLQKKEREEKNYLVQKYLDAKREAEQAGEVK
jgi:electron transport complex protein RnfE